MSTIFYSLSGEGRGHATRARTMIEELRGRHSLVVFAPEMAFELLEPIYRKTEVRIEKIPGLRFEYDRHGRVRFLGTLLSSADFIRRLESRVHELLPTFEIYRPDLVVADFEPIVPRAARLLGVPFVSFDHQHYLVVNDLSELPLVLRQKAMMAAPFVRALYDWQVETVVSSFHRAPLRRNIRNVTQIGTLIRPEVRQMRPSQDGFLLVYMRRHPVAGLFDALSSAGLPVRLYGLGVHPDRDNIRFCAVDEKRFVEDLARCEAVVTTAGNQLVGEALFLHKPVLAVPEPNNFEQAVNAHYLERTGHGRAVFGRLDAQVLTSFVGDLGRYRDRIVPEAVWGNRDAVTAIERHVGGPSTQAAAVLPLRPARKRARR